MVSSPATQPIIVKIDPDLEDLAPAYLESRKNDLPTIEAAVLNEDYKALAVFGHKMRGVGASYGFPQLSVIGADMENFANTQNKEGMVARFKELKDYLENIEIRFE